ncbi:YjbF family lipoprotein [Tolumonas lignilytica]|uniref:YjbF family lipoprotein n=1 Tax=Tolumonas lignilytica TaxID=1283284 RepID=UPI000463ADA2|nr:YjbF family lipoprotein [Tolumonas lignilytica]
MVNLGKNALLLCLIASGLSACSNYARDVADTVKLATTGLPDANISPDYIKKLPYASVYIQVDDAAKVFSVLAEVENNKELKWVTADHYLLTTKNGRVIKTIGFSEDITHTSNTDNDPLAQGITMLNTHPKWESTVFWSKVFKSGYKITSEFEPEGVEQIKILDQEKKLIRYDEHCEVAELNYKYTNHFWLDPITNKVVKSEQYMGPGLPVLKITTLKQYSSGS